MKRLQVGAFLSSFKLDLRSALEKASEIGLAGMQLSNLEGEIDVEQISESRAAEIRGLFSDHGLMISSVCGDIGGFALEDTDEAARRVARTRIIMDNTKKLGASIVQTHIGMITANFEDFKVATMRKCLEEIGGHGEKTGVFLATETGPEPASVMKDFLDALAVPAIKVNYDPANLVMKGFDCISGVDELKDYIIHTHAKDGRKVPDDMGRREQPLGEGEVDFQAYVGELDRIGYDGFYVIEREVGDNPVEDIIHAKRFLDRF